MKEIGTQTSFGKEGGAAMRRTPVPRSNELLERWGRVAEAYRRNRQQPVELPAADTSIFVPSTAPWLSLVEKRIEGSILPDEYQADRTVACRSGEWLEEDVARSAMVFFQNAADLLPGEPYLYSSRTGSLVAEFEAPHGRLTTIVSPESVAFFTVHDGHPVQTTVKRFSNSLRETLKELRALLVG